MAVELATAYVSLVPSFKGAQKAIASELGDSSAVAEAGRRSGLGWVKGASKVLGGAVLAGVGATAGVALTKGFTRAIQLQDAEAKLTGLGHSAENVAKISDNALGAVKGTAFGMGEAMTVAANAVAAGVKPGQELERNLRLVGDAATIAGTDMGSMGAIFNKVAASNKVQMDVINQLHDAGVPALSLLADQMGVTADEASKMASAGQVDFATFQAAMEKGLGGAAQASGQTFTGAMKNMGAALGRLGAMFATPVVEGMPSLFSAITSALDSLGPVLKPVAEEFGARLGPALESAAGWIAQVDFGALVESARGGLGPLAQIATSLSPVGLVLKGMAPVLPQIGSALGDIGSAIGGVLSTALPVVADAFAAVGAELAGAISQALPALVPLFEALAETVPALTPALVAVVPLVADLAVAAIRLVTPLLSSETTIKALVVAFLAWKAAVAGIALAGLVTGVVKSTVALGSNTLAWVRNTAAVVASKAQTLALVAMYAGSFIASVVRATASWVANTAAMVANKAAMVAQSVASKAVVAGQTAMRVAQLALNAAMRANPIGLIITAITALVGALVWFFTKTEVGKKIVTAVWGAIKTAIKSVADWWTNTAWPAIKAVIDWFGAAFQAAGKIISGVWANIRSAIAASWNWINKWVITPFKLALEALKYTFQVVKDAIGKAWDTMKSGLSTGWNWIKKNVFDPLKNGVSLVGDAFSNVKDAIGTAWDKLKSIAAKPVNFVLGTVYNDGIREWWNKIAGAVGLESLKLPKASLVKFASGGVLPGYTPGRDVHEFYSPTAGRLSLSGGEAIMRPEFTRAVGGAKGVARLNAMARRGQAFASGGVFGRRPETGGFWDNVGGVASSIGRGLRSFGESLWDAGAMAVEIIKDPIGAIKRAVSQIMENAGSGGNSGGFFDIVGTLPAKFAVGLAEKVKSMLGVQQTDGGGAAGAPAGALGVARMSQIVRALVPGARVTSGFRPGAITATGFPSMHGMGRAIDIAAARPGDSAGMMAIFNALRAAYPNATELIYSPAGGRQLYKGKPKFYGEPTRGDHWDHVHWAMKNGGVIPSLYDQGGWLPDGGVGVNLTGRPEAVLTPDESAALKAGMSGGPLVGTLVVRDEHAAIDELERFRRRELTRARMTGVLR